jgi:hypothetical protein
MFDKYFLYGILGVCAMWFIIDMIIKIPGKILQSKFAGLGTLSGRTKDEIYAVVGPPNSISYLEEGKTFCQWSATNYHIALTFDNEICEGVNSEMSV